MNDSADHRLEELFVRYWDDALRPREADELHALLAADPVARERFQLLCTQAVVAAELPPAAVEPTLPTTPLPQPHAMSRRRALRYLGWGMAACAVAGAVGGYFAFGTRWRRIRVASVRGTVTMRTASGVESPLTGEFPPGATLSTHGFGSSAVLNFSDGTSVSFLSDSEATVGEDGRSLRLHRGTASAAVPPRAGEAIESPLIATNEATLTDMSGVVMTLGRAQDGTEVGVHKGQLRVATSASLATEVVRDGEILTVRGDGKRRKQAMAATPEEYLWDLSVPLGSDWRVGKREVVSAGPVVKPEYWFDPYHQTEMWQIRSNNQWTRGFCQLRPDSSIWIRYWLERPGPSQFCMCVRTPRVPDPATGMLESNGIFQHARARKWQWLELKAGTMLDNLHTPAFAAPWVAFLYLFNTYKDDLGLQIAEVRMTRRGVRPPGA